MDNFEISFEGDGKQAGGGVGQEAEQHGLAAQHDADGKVKDVLWIHVVGKLEGVGEDEEEAAEKVKDDLIEDQQAGLLFGDLSWRWHSTQHDAVRHRSNKSDNDDDHLEHVHADWFQCNDRTVFRMPVCSIDFRWWRHVDRYDDVVDRMVAAAGLFTSIDR